MLEKYLRFEKIEQNHQSALKNIIKHAKDEKYLELKALVEFFLETDINPYAFLPASYAGIFDTSTGLSSLIDVISHALYDDGDISFPIVNGEPRIVFANRFETDYKDKVLTNTEKEMEKRLNDIFGPERNYEITHARDAFDFIDKLKKYHVSHLKKCFVTDAKRFGIKFAKDHYSQYQDFEESWETLIDVNN